MHEFDGKALIFMIFNNDAIKNELSGLLDTSRQARRHHLIFLLKIALAMFLILCFAGFAVGIGFVRGAIDAAPSLDIIDVQPQGYASQIYDADGNLMQTLVMEGSNREEVSFDQLPDDLVNAFIAIEDSRFYEHNGIDLKGILRAAYVGITNGRFSEGASTITQQLIKNNVLQGGYETNMADKLRRKIQEQFLAVKLEDQLDSKETILEYYLNTINLGGNCLGVQTAANRYFGKNVWELTLSECSVLAATTSNPSRYNPLTHPKENAVRRKIVLEKMYEQNFITYDQKMMHLMMMCTAAFRQLTTPLPAVQFFLILLMLYIIRFVMICSQSLAILPHNLISFSTVAACRFIQQWIRPFNLLSMKRSTMLTITSLQQEADF